MFGIFFAAGCGVDEDDSRPWSLNEPIQAQVLVQAGSLEAVEWKDGGADLGRFNFESVSEVNIKKVCFRIESTENISFGGFVLSPSEYEDGYLITFNSNNVGEFCFETNLTLSESVFTLICGMEVVGTGETGLEVYLTSISFIDPNYPDDVKIQEYDVLLHAYYFRR